MDRADLIRYIDFEVSSLCNAGCSVCPRRNHGQYSEFTQTYWTLKDTKRVIDTNIISNLHSVLFCGNFGDAMGNPEISKIGRYFRDNNNRMTIHVKTNGGIGDPKLYKEMAKLGAIFTFGLDGVGEKNELYRVNVKWDNVLRNVEEFTKNCVSSQFEIQFIMWNETTDQIVPMIDFLKSIGKGSLYLRKPYTSGGDETEVYNMKGESTHFLTEIKDNRLEKYFETKWNFNQLDGLKNEIESLNLEIPKIKEGTYEISKHRQNKEKTYEYSEVRFSEKEINELNKINKQTCFSKNSDNPSDLTKESFNIFITHNKLLMPCCFIPPNISNEMYHSTGYESPRQREMLNKMLDIGFDEFSLKDKTLREVFNNKILDKFVYDDLKNNTQFSICKTMCGKCE